MWKATPKEYYKQFEGYKEPKHSTTFFTSQIGNLAKSLKKVGVKFHYIKWSKKIVKAGPEFEYEYFAPKEEGSYLYVSERNVYFSSTVKNGKIYLKHHIEPNIREDFNKVMMEYFPGRTLGWQTDVDAITIELVKKKKLKKIKEKETIYAIIEAKGKSVDELVKKVGKSIKAYGYITEYDATTKDGKWYVDLNVDKDKVGIVKEKLGIKK